MTRELQQGFNLGEYRVDPPSGTLSGPSDTHHVTPAAMDVLVCLATKPGHLITREELLDTVWRGSDSGDAALTRCIGELRQQLGDHADNPRYIQTLPRRGYRLLASVSPLQGDEQTQSSTMTSANSVHPATFTEFVAELRRRRVIRVCLVYMVASWVIIQVAQTTFPALLVPDWAVSFVVALCVLGFPVAVILAWAYQVEPESGDNNSAAVQLVVDKRRQIDFVIIAALIAAVMILTYELYVREAETEPTTTTELDGPAIDQQADATATDLADRPTIAVLPFDNLTDDPANQDIADGMVEELLNELVRIRELRVVGRTASFYYRNKVENWRTIADTLGASMIVEGSIRRDKGKIRVAAQLIDRTGYHLWSETYDTTTERSLELLDVQRDIAREVAEAMPIKLSDESRSVLANPPTEDEQIFQLYMQARSYLRAADHSEEYRSAETLFRQALAQEPDFVDALSGLCEAQLKIYTLSYRPQDYAAAISTCSKLMSEDKLNTVGYIALGDLNRLSGNYEEAKSLFEKALELDPTAEPALYGLARSVEGLGDYGGAKWYYDESVRLDPGYWRVYIGYGRYLERGGDFEGAIKHYQQVIQLSPGNQEGYTNLGAAYFDNDQWDEAAEAWEKAVEANPDPYAYLNVGTAEYYRGNYEKAAEYFRTGIYASSEFYPLWGKLGAALERLGQLEESRASFQNAADYAEATVQINPKDSRAIYLLASYLAHLGRYDEARERSAQAVALSPEDPTVHYFNAIVESLAGDDDAAVDALATALRLGYSVRIIKHGPYFDSYLNSAKLAEWMIGGG